VLIVARDGATLDADAVRTVVREQLARHKVPRDVTFVDEIPRNTTGKLLRSQAAGSSVESSVNSTPGPAAPPAADG
jgi:fatty-acyl-CoA synthase